MASHEALRLIENDDFLSESLAAPTIIEPPVTLQPAIALPTPSDPHNRTAALTHCSKLHATIDFLGGTLFRKGALSLFDQGIVSATNFLTMILLGRTAEHELGIYQLGFSIVLLATCIQNALISSPYTLFGNRLNGQQRAQYAGSTLVHQWIFSGLVTLVLAAVGLGIAFGGGSSSFDFIAWILAAMLPFILVREFVRRVTFAHLQLIAVVCLDAAVSAMQLGGLFLLKASDHLTAGTAFGAIGLACAIAGGITFFLMRRRFAPKRTSTLTDLRRNWSFGKWAFGAQVATLTSAYCIPWMLALLRGTAETGRYSACLSIVLIVNPLVIGLNNFLGPHAIHAYHADGLKGLRRLTWTTSLGLLLVLTTITVVMIAFGGKILALLYGQKLVGNALPVSILAVGMLVLAAGLGIENGLTALNRPAFTFWSYLAGLAVTLLACALLIVPYGVVGAATASLVGIMVATSIKMVLFDRACRLQARSAA